MCGVFGTTRGDLWQARLPSVLRLLRHRGPDDEGVWSSRDGSVVLAHTRLAIIGLGEAGDQPVVSTDGSLTVSYNGEIYNYRDLARELGLPGTPTSDSRVLCELLRTDGPARMGRARGMYAAALWDDRNQTLSAVRDPWGIKPLYLLRHPSGGVAVSSEIPPLLESPDAREIDPVALVHYIIHGHTGATATMFRHITKVPVGTAMSWQRSGPGWAEQIERIDPYPRVAPIGTFSEAIADSVFAHLVADVEVGVFLSGGLDSTLLSAVARDYAPAVRTFTLAFPGHPEIDESPLAEANARALGVQFNRVPVTAEDMVAAADVFLGVHGEPLGDAAVLPLTCLSMVAGREVKVVLAGEGADEMFGGYGRYRVSAKLDHPAVRLSGRITRPAASRWAWRRSDRPRDRALEAILWGGGPRSHGALLGSEAGWLTASSLPWAADVARVVHAEWMALSDNDSELARARGYDLHRWLPNVYLEKTDRATMASSLEARVPYLDPAVADMPRTMTSPPKAAIREELLRRVPRLQTPDRKKGLAVSLASILDGTLGEAGHHQLSSHRSILARVAGRAWQTPLQQRAERSPALAFRLAMLGQWEHLFSERITVG